MAPLHIEVHTFLFTSLFDADVVNGILNLQYEYYIYELIGRVVLVDGHPLFNKTTCSVFVGAPASTMLSSAEFISLSVAIARSSGRNCALAAPGGSRTQYEFIC